jgi:hypothetical protein
VELLPVRLSEKVTMGDRLLSVTGRRSNQFSPANSASAAVAHSGRAVSSREIKLKGQNGGVVVVLLSSRVRLSFDRVCGRNVMDVLAELVRHISCRCDYASFSTTVFRSSHRFVLSYSSVSPLHLQASGIMNCKEQHLPELELTTGQVREALQCILHTILL